MWQCRKSDTAKSNKQVALPMIREELNYRGGDNGADRMVPPSYWPSVDWGLAWPVCTLSAIRLNDHNHNVGSKCGSWGCHEMKNKLNQSELFRRNHNFAFENNKVWRRNFLKLWTEKTWTFRVVPGIDLGGVKQLVCVPNACACMGDALAVVAWAHWLPNEYLHACTFRPAVRVARQV